MSGTALGCPCALESGRGRLCVVMGQSESADANMLINSWLQGWLRRLRACMFWEYGSDNTNR